MTVIAGAILFSGVILLADTRATIKRRGRPNIHADVAQKIIQLTPTTVVSFSGNVHTAALILKMAISQVGKRPHFDAVSLRQWLPRLLKHAYRRYGRRHGSPELSFLVGSVVFGSNLVERAKVVPIFETIGFGRSPIQRNFVPDIVMRILMRPTSDTYVPISVGAHLPWGATSATRMAPWEHSSSSRADWEPRRFYSDSLIRKRRGLKARTADNKRRELSPFFHARNRAR